MTRRRRYRVFEYQRHVVLEKAEVDEIRFRPLLLVGPFLSM